MKAMHLAILALLGGCASIETASEVNRLRERLDSFIEAEPVMIIDLIDRDGLSAAEIEAREIEIMKAANPKCVAPYWQHLNSAAAVADPQTAMATASTLPELAERLGAELTICLAQFGVTGGAVMTVDGADMDVPQHLRRGTAIATLYREALARAHHERETSRLWLAYGMIDIGRSMQYRFVNPEQIYVPTYRRDDGTMVRGHRRTMPNSQCSDNFQGCP